MVVLDATWSAPLKSLKRPFRRGVETIELMLSLPVLLLVIFAGFEYGWAILRSIQLDHAARVGAREAALSGATAESIENSIRTSLNGLGMPSAVITLSPADPSAAPAGTSIQIDVQVEYSNVQLLGLSRLMPLPESLRGRASMVREPDS